MSLSIVIEAQSESAGANRAASSAGKKQILWRGKRQLKDDCTDFLLVGSEDEEFFLSFYPPPPSISSLPFCLYLWNQTSFCTCQKITNTLPFSASCHESSPSDDWCSRRGNQKLSNVVSSAFTEGMLYIQYTCPTSEVLIVVVDVLMVSWSTGIIKYCPSATRIWQQKCCLGEGNGEAEKGNLLSLQVYEPKPVSWLRISYTFMTSYDYTSFSSTPTAVSLNMPMWFMKT